jgi:hypothetical protein
MQWPDIRKRYPGQWLLLEALEAHSEGGFRKMDKLAVLNSYPNSQVAFQDYRSIHRDKPDHELFIAHTDKEALEIKERFG